MYYYMYVIFVISVFRGAGKGTQIFFSLVRSKNPIPSMEMGLFVTYKNSDICDKTPHNVSSVNINK